MAKSHPNPSDTVLSTKSCPVSTTIHLIGGKYKALILWHLMSNTLRFSELRKAVPEATSKMLTQQLRELESDGLINRTVYPVVPPKVEYSLTERGQELFPILSAMYDWGIKLLDKQGIKPTCPAMHTTPQKAAEFCGESCSSAKELDISLS